MKTSEKLTQAWALLQTPGAWTKGHFAKTAEGEHTYGSDPKAVCWCSLGAYNKIDCTGDEKVFSRQGGVLLSKAAAQIAGNGVSIVQLNDAVQDVQELAPVWELAIKLAKESEA